MIGFRIGDRVRLKTEEQVMTAYVVPEDLAEGIICEVPPGGKDNRFPYPAEDLVLVAPAMIFAALHVLSVDDGIAEFPAHTDPELGDPIYIRDDLARALAEAASRAILKWHEGTLTSTEINALGEALMAYELATKE